MSNTTLQTNQTFNQCTQWWKMWVLHLALETEQIIVFDGQKKSGLQLRHTNGRLILQSDSDPLTQQQKKKLIAVSDHTYKASGSSTKIRTRVFFEARCEIRYVELCLVQLKVI